MCQDWFGYKPLLLHKNKGAASLNKWWAHFGMSRDLYSQVINCLWIFLKKIRKWLGDHLKFFLGMWDLQEIFGQSKAASTWQRFSMLLSSPLWMNRHREFTCGCFLCTFLIPPPDISLLHVLYSDAALAFGGLFLVFHACSRILNY